MHTDDISAYTHHHVFDHGNPAGERVIEESKERHVAEDAARATSTQVRDLVHYVEQSNPNVVEELSTAQSLNDGEVLVPLAHDLLQ